MSDSPDVYRKAQALGLTLEADGADLVVKPRSKCPLEFVSELKQHKTELLDWLEARTANLTSDCMPWLHMARQILAGRFDGADRSTLKVLFIGVRNIQHPLCVRAKARLLDMGAEPD